MQSRNYFLTIFLSFLLSLSLIKSSCVDTLSFCDIFNNYMLLQTMRIFAFFFYIGFHNFISWNLLFVAIFFLLLNLLSLLRFNNCRSVYIWFYCVLKRSILLVRWFYLRNELFSSDLLNISFLWKWL